VVFLDELGGFGFRLAVDGRAVLEVHVQPAPQQATVRIDVVDHHRGDVCVGDAHERERTCLVGDHAHLDGFHVSSPI
jgi:hypothetical protein